MRFYFIFFELIREEDVAGISGTGKVAVGVLVRSGIKDGFIQAAFLVWRGKVTSLTVYDDIAKLAMIHCHEGKSRIQWVGSLEPQDNKLLREQITMLFRVKNWALDGLETIMKCYREPD